MKERENVMRKLVSSVLAAIGVLVSTSVLAQPIKIGAPQPMTGPDAPFGDKFKKAYTMAVEEINAAGGVNGRKLEIIIEDHQAKNQLAATVAEKLITEEKVLVMTGGRASGQAMEIASVCQRLKTPYLVDHPSADMITAKGFEWVFRNNPTGSIYPAAFKDFITKYPGAMPKSAAVIYDNTLFGKTIGDAVIKILKSKNVSDRGRRGLSGEHARLQADHDQGEGDESGLRAAGRGGDHRRHPAHAPRQGNGASRRAPSSASAAASASPISPRSSAPWPRTSSPRPRGPGIRTTRRRRPSTRSSTRSTASGPTSTRWRGIRPSTSSPTP